VTKKDIEVFLINYLIEKEGKGIKKLLFKINLLENGIIDSLDLVTISIELEKKFKIKINPNSSKTLKNFTNLNKMIDYIYSEKK